jgi:hypothetical protein
LERVRNLGFLAVATILLLPAATPADAAATVSGPFLRPGDLWMYRTNTSLSSGLSLNGLVTLTVTGHATTEVEGRPYDAYILSVSGQGTASGTLALRFGSTQASGDWTVSGREVVDARGLKILSSVLDLEANGTLHLNPIPLSFELSVQNTTSFRVDTDPWHFPLAVGATAVVRNQMNFSEEFRLVYFGVSPTPTHSAGLVWSNVTYSLDPAVGIDTPAGHFDAYPIREAHADGSTTVSFFAPIAGNHARTEARNQTSELGSADLVSYRYQALEPPTFLGLTADRWVLVAVVIVIGMIGLILIWRLRRKGRPEPREETPPAT